MTSIDVALAVVTSRVRSAYAGVGPGVAVSAACALSGRTHRRAGLNGYVPGEP